MELIDNHRDPNIKDSLSRVILYVTRPEETKNCNFWIGLFRSGSTSPTELYGCNSVEEVYYKASQEGINDSKPILISNTEKIPAHHFFLLPYEELLTSQEESINSITKVLEAINPKRAGLYFSRELIDTSASLALLRKVLLSCQKTTTKEFYLFSGKHGVNSVLNTALDVKEDLRESMSVLVFH